MTGLSKLFGLSLLVVLAAGPSLAQESGADQDQDQGQQSQGEQQGSGSGYQVEDVIVVTASRTEQRLQEVPAAMTVIGSQELETLPADDYGDILRNVPGLNVSQMSARDIQIAGRGATSSLSNSQLVLLDGRTVYLDFFGFVMWDLLPVDFGEIKQVEVLRGPASAVWGANALGGVVNLITKTPKESIGTAITLGAGELDTAFASITHGAAGDDWGFKISGSWYEQDPYDRPTGTINNAFQTPYPPFQNGGTEQPKVDLRFDRDLSNQATLSFQAGYAGTDGIVHSGIGPFDVDSSSNLSYGKATWLRRALRVSFFANLLDGSATNLLTVGIDGRPLEFAFQSDTYNLDFSNTNVVGGNNILTYGATARKLTFDLSIAPGEDSRDELGVFLQDEILIGDKLRWLIGARWDDIDPINSVVSPRTSLAWTPKPNHTFRISYNEAFRAPSLVENYLQTAIVNLVVLPTGPFIFPSLAVGNPLLQEESLTAYEVGYVGSFNQGRTTVTLALYRNELDDATDFFTAATYNSANPPPGWPLPPIFLDFPPLAGALPAVFSYRNIGEIVNQGLEFSLDYRPSSYWRYFFNYSYQDEPDVTGIPLEQTNIPPENRVNAGVAYNGERYFADATVNYADSAIWTDVLDARFAGPTDSYTMVNLSLGVHLWEDKVTLSLIGSNIFDEDVQQHVFGDIISRKITGQVRFRF